MVSFELFLFGLLLTSTLTGLVTEAVKKLLNELNKAYRANILAGAVACVLSTALCVSYVVVTNMQFTAVTLVYLLAHTFLSWLCAMVGYDKVIQSISQFKLTEQKEE